MVHFNLREVLIRYRIDEKHGFLTKCDLSLLSSYYQPWIDFCDALPARNDSEQIRKDIEELDELSITNLETYESYRIAHVLLVTITSAYLWHDLGNENEEKTPDKLPRNIAKPLKFVSEHIGVLPVVAHCSTCLANWHLIDPNKLLCAENIQLNAFKFFGNEAETWFFAVTAEIENNFAPSISYIIEATHAVENDNPIAENRVLNSIAHSLKTSKTSLEKMPIRLPPEFFYKKLRRFLWGYNQSNLKENGIMFEGFGELGRLKCGGATAAQSSTLQLVDAFLGIQHEGETKELLDQQLLNMPREHRELIAWVRKIDPSKLMSRESDLFQNALKAAKDFRTSHIRTVTRYIVMQADDSGALGTGGSPVVNFLKSVRDDVE